MQMQLTISQYRKRLQWGFMTKGIFWKCISSLTREIPLNVTWTCWSGVSDILERGKQISQRLARNLDKNKTQRFLSVRVFEKVTRQKVCASFARLKLSTSHPLLCARETGGFHSYGRWLWPKLWTSPAEWKATMRHNGSLNFIHAQSASSTAESIPSRVLSVFPAFSSANCFCASLLRTKFTRHVMHRARALSSKVNNNRANGQCITLRGFHDLGRSVTPIFSFRFAKK